MTTTTNIPKEVEEAHVILCRELFLLYTKWNDFKTLYCTNDESVELLEYAARLFFRINQEVLRDDIILGVCRLTDPAKSKVRGVDRDNLTIEHLAEKIPSEDRILRGKMSPLLKTVKEKTANFRIHRNRRIAHDDLEAHLNRVDSLMPGLSITYVDDAFASLAEVLNTVERYYDNNQRTYHNGVYGRGGGSDLLEFIERNKALEKYFERKEFGDSR